MAKKANPQKATTELKSFRWF